MRNVILMMLLAGVTSSAATAEWVRVNTNDTTTVYVDPTTIRRAGNLVQVVNMRMTCLDCNNIQLLGTNRYTSQTQQVEYDCKEERARTIFGIAFLEDVAEGKTIDSANGPTDWRPVSPGSIDESIWKIACGKR